MAKSDPIRVRLDLEDQARLKELVLRTGQNESFVGRAAIRLLYAEVKRRGETGFLLDELAGINYDQLIDSLSPTARGARLNERPPGEKKRA